MMKQMIFRFNLLLICFVFLVGCSNTIHNQVETKIEQVQKQHQSIDTLTIFGLLQNKDNTKKINQVEKQLEKSLTIKIIEANKQSITLEITTIPLETLLSRAKMIFEDSTIGFDVQLQHLKQTIKELSKETQTITYQTMDELDVTTLVLKQYQSKYAEIEKFQQWINTFIPIINY